MFGKNKENILNINIWFTEFMNKESGRSPLLSIDLNKDEEIQMYFKGLPKESITIDKDNYKKDIDSFIDSFIKKYDIKDIDL